MKICLERRIALLEQRRERRERLRLSPERRKLLTYRAVREGDPEALRELALYRPAKIGGTNEQCAAALAAGLRADT